MSPFPTRWQDWLYVVLAALLGYLFVYLFLRAAGCPPPPGGP